MAEVYEQYNLELYRYAYRLLGSEDQAEECVAETFLRFLGALSRNQGPKKHLRAYLYRVAHNWIVDAYRRGPPPMVSIDSEQTEGIAHGGLPVSRLVERNLRSEQVRQALRELTPEQRQVIVLKYLEGWSNLEIAQVVQKNVGAVKALQARALAKLSGILGADSWDES